MPIPHSIDAPYNFVPLADWVWTPDWAALVSHDLPFKDGLCGHLDLTITAHSPVLVGREHGPDEAPCRDHPGQVHPWQLPNGRYGLPGTALKGMLRNVIEIATFSRMVMVDEQRLGVRDLTSPARRIYGDHMTQTVAADTYEAQSRAGWLSFDTDKHRWLLEPCDYARVEHRDLLAYRPGPWVALNQRPTAKKKYDAWAPTPLAIRFDPGPLIDHPHSGGKSLVYRKASALGRGHTDGTLVFTGQPSPRKHLEFIFFNPAGRGLPVPEQVFRGFLDIHDQKTERTPISPWDEWRTQPRVPVFWLADAHGNIASLGLAMMYKLPYRHSLHEAIGHSSARHLEAHGIDQLDLATLLFGRVGDKPEDCLRGRVSIGHAIALGNPQPQALAATILNGPKPTYYPNYIRQPRAQNNRIPANDRRGYSTLMEEGCQLRGWKRYPARPLAQVQPQALTGEQAQNNAVQVILNPLPAGTEFKTWLTFHNLKPVELGALCWALTWGGQSGLRHGLGMGKPFGYGQLGIEIAATDLRPNRPDTAPPSWRDCIGKFVDAIDQAHRSGRPGGRRWRDATEVRTLLAMADPTRRPAGDSQLRHMPLDTEQDNDFKKAKEHRLVLADYPLAPAPRWTTDDPDAPPATLTWAGVTVKLNPGSGELQVSHPGHSARAVNPAAQAIRDALPAAAKERLKKKRELKGCTVTVEQVGNAWRLTGIQIVP